MVRLKSVFIFKNIIILSCILISVYFLFFQKLSMQINDNQEKIYDLQIIMSDLLHQKMRYMSEINFSYKDKWVPIENIDGHIFSAYLELRPEVIVTNISPNSDLPWAQIQIIAILPLNIVNNNQIDCIIKITTKEHSIYQRQSSKIKVFEDNWNFKYSVSFITCDLIYQNHLEDEILVKELPESVGISLKSSENLNSVSFVDIHYPKNGFNQHRRWNKTKSMAICIPIIIQRDFNHTTELIQFIEYYRLIGFTHFTFYQTSVTQEVDHILKFYQDMNIATVISWHLSSIYIDDKKALRLQGLSAALNDCHFRNSFFNDYEYIGIFDIDEFLILKFYKSLTELLEHFDPFSQEFPQYTSFSFKNFYPNIGKERFNSESSHLQTRIVPQKYAKTSRLSWSRYLVRAQDVTVLDYRFTELQLNQNFLRFKEMIVDPAVAFLHYYNPSETEKTGYYVKSMEIDAIKEKLKKKVAEVYSLMFVKKKYPSSV